MPELAETIAYARALAESQPAAIPSAYELVEAYNAEAPPRNGREWERRRLLLELLVELERARINRAEWYVWICEEYSRNRHSFQMDSGRSSRGLSPGVIPDEIC
jgi:hypothetical protein